MLSTIFTLFPYQKTGCGKSEYFEVGHKDFSDAIKMRKIIEEQNRLRCEDASNRIQKAYRSYLRRMYAKAQATVALAERRLHYKAATAINKGVRGRLARRRAITERYLLTIKKAHSMLLKQALGSGPGRTKVFWYKREEVVQLLFADYVALISRTGHQPPRSVVEANVKEIARRIVARQNELVTVVQKIFRGLVARRITRFFKLQVKLLFEWWVANVLKIQRAFRGFKVRLHLPELKALRFREKQMDQYLKSKRIQQTKAKIKRAIGVVKGAYIKEHAEERTARFTTRIEPPSSYGMQKMKAFAASCYSDDRLPNAIDNMLSFDLSLRSDEVLVVEEERKRRKFLNDRISEHGPVGFGYRGFNDKETLHEKEKEIKAFHKKSGKNVVGDIDKIFDLVTDPLSADREEKRSPKLSPMSEKSKTESIFEKKTESSRSTAMRKLFQSELTTLVNSAIERVKHDFRKPGLVSKFSEHNKLKQTTGLLDFKFPKDINDKPMDWLNEDIELVIKYKDVTKKLAREDIKSK
jgi:hypothetical protein